MVDQRKVPIDLAYNKLLGAFHADSRVVQTGSYDG